MFMDLKKYPWKNKIVICNKVAYPVDEFVLLCLDLKSSTAVSKQLGCARTTVNNCIKKYFPELEGGSCSIRTKFLKLLNLKHCSKCNNFLDPSCFWKNKSRPDGLNHYCKKCQSCIDNTRERNHKEEYAKRSSYYKEKAARRRCSILERTPNWADLSAIKEFYLNCPEGYHVDHIVPLQGDLVSGLHVLENLQYLSPEENLKKGNSFSP